MIINPVPVVASLFAVPTQLLELKSGPFMFSEVFLFVCFHKINHVCFFISQELREEIQARSQKEKHTQTKNTVRAKGA